jgi:hypothetical protein
MKLIYTYLYVHTYMYIYEEGDRVEEMDFHFFFLDSTARKNMQNNLYKKQDYLFFTITVL